MSYDLALQGTYLLSQAFARTMVENNESPGAIVNVSSIVGKVCTVDKWSMSPVNFCRCHKPVVVASNNNRFIQL